MQRAAAAIKIQCAWRITRSREARMHFAEKKRWETEMLKIHAATTKIQRGWKQCMHNKTMKEAKIKADIRMHTEAERKGQSHARASPAPLSEEIRFEEWFKIPSLMPINPSFADAALQGGSPLNYDDDDDIDMNVTDIVARVNSATPQLFYSSQSSTPLPTFLPERPKSVNNLSFRSPKRSMKFARPETSFLASRDHESFSSLAKGRHSAEDYSFSSQLHSSMEGRAQIGYPSLKGDSFLNSPDESSPWVDGDFHYEKHTGTNQSGEPQFVVQEEMGLQGIPKAVQSESVLPIGKGGGYEAHFTSPSNTAHAEVVVIFDTVRFYRLFYAKKILKLGYSSWQTHDADELVEYLRKQPAASLLLINADMPDDLHFKIIQKVRHTAMPKWNIPIVSYCTGLEQVRFRFVYVLHVFAFAPMMLFSFWSLVIEHNTKACSRRFRRLHQGAIHYGENSKNAFQARVFC